MLKEKKILHVSEMNTRIKGMEDKGIDMNHSNTCTPYHDHMKKILVTFGVDIFKDHHADITERFFSNRRK